MSYMLLLSITELLIALLPRA